MPFQRAATPRPGVLFVVVRSQPAPWRFAMLDVVRHVPPGSLSRLVLRSLQPVVTAVLHDPAAACHTSSGVLGAFCPVFVANCPVQFVVRAGPSFALSLIHI